MHCSECGERVESEKLIPGTKTRLMIMCSCRKAYREKLEKEQRFLEKERKFRCLKEFSVIGQRYKDVSFENSRSISEKFDTLMERCAKYCSVAPKALSDGLGIYLYGGSGTGKTHICACIHNELKKEYQCLFTSFFEISKALRARYKADESDALIFKRLKEIDFLFLDDFGTEKFKTKNEDNWLQGVAFDIINGRYIEKKPTLFSSNYSIEQLVNERGLLEKTADRIYEMGSLICKIDGQSTRNLRNCGLRSV